MKNKTIFKRLLSGVLATAIMVNCIPVNVFAATTWTGEVLEAKNSDTLTLSEIIDKVGEPESVKVTEDYTLTWEKGSKDVQVEIEDTLYHLKVGNDVYNNKSDKDTSFSFPETNTYSIYTGSAEYDVSIKEGTTWKTTWDSLLAEVETAKSALTTAQENASSVNKELEEANGKLSLAKSAESLAQTAYDEAESDYNNSETARAEAQEQLNSYKSALDSATSAYNSAKDALDKAQADYDSATGYKKMLLKAALEAAKAAMPAVESALATAQADYNEQAAVVGDAEAYKAKLKADMDTAKANLDTAKANTATVQDEVDSVQAKVNEANNAVATAQTNVDNAWDNVAAHAETITSADFNSTYVSYDDSVETEVKTFAVNIYHELTVSASVVAGDIAVPEVTVSNATEISENVYKVLETNSDVVIGIPSVSGYYVMVDNVTIDNNSYNVGSLTTDKEVTIAYAEAGASTVVVKGEEYADVKLSENVVNGIVKAEKEVTVEVSPKEHFRVDSVVVTDKENNTVATVSNVPFALSFIANEDCVPEGNTYTVTVNGVYTSSKLIYNGASDIVEVSAEDYTFGSVVKAGETVDVSVNVEDSYELTVLKITDKDSTTYAEGDLNKGTITFTAPENAGEYTLIVETKDIHNSVTVAEDDAVKSVKLTDKVTGTEYISGEKTIPVNATVVAEVEINPEYGYLAPEVKVVSDSGELTVSGENGKYEFTVGSDTAYSFTVVTENTQSSLTMGSVEGATVEITVNNNKYTVGDKINSGSTVVVTIIPDDNCFITSAEVIANEMAKSSVGAVTKEYGSWKITFTAHKSNYVLNVSTNSPIVAPNAEDVTINMYDIITDKKATVETELFSAFETADGITELGYEYLAGEIAFPETVIIPNVVTIPAFTHEVWVGLYEEIPTVDSIANDIWASINDISPTFGRFVTVKTIKNILNEMENLIGEFHSFGEENEEKVRAVFEGSDLYQPTTSASRIIKVQDLRTEIDVDINTEISVVYGSYTSNDVILAKLLKDKQGVVVNGTALGDKYNKMLSISEDLVKADVGIYTIEVFMADTDYDYKDAVKATATVTVTKADAEVTMTKNNVILYKNLAGLTKDYFMQIAPDVAVEDEVGHLSFLMGLDANINDPAKPTVFATVDLSQVGSLKVGNIDLPVTSEVADMLVKVLGGEDGLTMSELLDSAENIKALIGGLGFDASLVEEYVEVETLKESLKALYAVLSEYSQYGEICIKFTNNENSVVPDSHGVYVIGAVTTDPNYNTSYGVTYIVITAEPVKVKFNDVNDNNARQFVYDGTQKSMTAYAVSINGEEIDGTMKYIYAGVQSDGTPFFGTEAPVHAGTYTVTALFNDAAYERAGIAIGAVVIWASDAAEVGVTDKKIVVYDENNEKPVDISDMIQLLPAGTDAKVAVITAGIDVATDFSEEGLNALEGVLNIDFPERADTILKKILPSAYTESGINLSTFVNALTEIKTAFEEAGVDASDMDSVVNALGKIPNATKLTFFNTYNGEIDENALPKKIGAYLVTAIIFDPDYLPEAGMGVLLITPDITEEKLAWDYDDMNGVITQPVLDNIDLGAYAVKDSANTAKIKYIFAALTKDGEIEVLTADETNIAEVSKGLRNGAYKQVAYIWDGFDATMTVAQPIVREFIHVPQQVHIDFEPDENVDNVRIFEYTGRPVEMPVTVEKLDKTELKSGCLEIRYVGTDSLGNKYDSTDAPTNVGVYTVTVTYKEYDVVMSTSLKYAGINVGVMVIEPVEPTVVVKVDDIECTCGCDEVSCTEECGDCDVAVNVTEKITVTDGAEYITVISDEEGNVNVLLPEGWNRNSSYTVNNIDEAVNVLLTDLENYEAVLDEQAASEAINELIKELKAIDTSILSEEAQEVVDSAIEKFESVTTESVKQNIKGTIKEIKALGITSEDVVNKVIEQLEALETKTDIEEVSKVLDMLISELEKVDTENLTKSTKIALAAAIVAVKELDMSVAKEAAKELRDTLIAELEALDTSVLSKTSADAINAVISQLETLDSELAEITKDSKSVVEQLKAVLDEVGTIKSFAVNGETTYDCGTYTVTAIAFGRNHKVATATDTFTIYPPEHECAGGVANCQSPAICEGCGNPHGAKDPTNHVGETELRYARPATKTEFGYTGDLYCKSCGELIKLGEKIPATGSDDSGFGSGSTSSSNNSTGSNKVDSNAPLTGDVSNMATWIFLVLASAAGIILLIVFKNKLKYEE